MTEKEINFNFKARYYKLGEVNSSTKQIWFVLHGYGQLAKYFIRKFNVLSEKNICVIAPEGLSHFYLEPTEKGTRKNDRVGATWMTKENRLVDIENYIQYLNSIYSTELKDTSVPVTVLGFSQGSATASRWVLQGEVTFFRLILWAGIFPTDMDFESGAKILEHREVYLVYGKQDPFLTDDRFTEMQKLTQKLNVKANEITFDGTHDIDEPTLLKLV
jgi:predicted esterase